LSGKNDDDSGWNDGYVYGQSVLGADKEFKAWVLNLEGYVHESETDKNGEEVVFIHKSRIYAKSVQLESKKGIRNMKTHIYQRQMVYYSQKYAQKQKKERELSLTKARDMISNPGKYTRATSVGAAGYINNIKFVKETGEVAEGVAMSLDIERIAEEEKYDGYYSIVTSEKEISDKEIRDIYKGLWEIEESFKIIKSEFKARPVYLRMQEHINAHFLICFIALLIIRIIEHKTAKKHSVKQIRDALIKYSCSYLDQNYYLFDYRDEVIQTLEKVLDLNLGNKIMALSEIKKILQYQ
jgi:IS4 transposase